MTSDVPSIASVASHLGPHTSARLVSTANDTPPTTRTALERLYERALEQPGHYVVIDASEYPDPDLGADVGDDVWVNVYGPDSVGFETYWGDAQPNSIAITIALA